MTLGISCGYQKKRTTKRKTFPLSCGQKTEYILVGLNILINMPDFSCNQEIFSSDVRMYVLNQKGIINIFPFGMLIFSKILTVIPDSFHHHNNARSCDYRAWTAILSIHILRHICKIPLEAWEDE